jgi:predicted dehydrogenase
MQLKAALIGCGAMSRVWLEAAAKVDGLRLVGLADLDTARAQQRASEFGLADAIITTSIEDLLSKANPDILFDVVVPAARHKVVAAALEAGCHVLSEKPMAETLDEARDLVACAKVASRIHAVIQNRRYLGSVRRIARAVRSQVFGTVSSVHADFFLAPHFGGFREDMDHVLLLDMAVHAFDAMRCMAGVPVRGVYAREWNPPNSWYRDGSSATAIFDLENGGVFTYRGSWCAEGLGTSWECAWRIVGTKGTLVWDGRENIQIEVGNGQRDGLFDGIVEIVVPALDPADHVGGHLGVLQDFVAAVRNGQEPETCGKDNIRSLAMSLGAIQSAQTGRRVDIHI